MSIEQLGMGQTVSVEVIRALGFWDYLGVTLLFFGVPAITVALIYRWYKNRGIHPSSFSGDSNGNFEVKQ